MNITAIVGFIVATSITAFAILTATSNPKIFADVHGIVIVIGGTLSVALLAFRPKRLKAALGVLARKMFGNYKIDFHGTIKAIVTTSVTYRTNPKAALDQLPADSHPFFKDGMKLLVEYGFNHEELEEILHSALSGKKQRDTEEGKVWLTVSRFPPAFGLLGATVGMISLLQTLGEPGAQDRIGPAMATALVATFYGLVTANFFLIPIAENLHEISTEELTLRKIIKEGVLLIQQKKHPTFIEEYLKSFLAPSQRMEEMTQGGGSGGAKAA